MLLMMHKITYKYIEKHCCIKGFTQGKTCVESALVLFYCCIHVFMIVWGYQLCSNGVTFLFLYIITLIVAALDLATLFQLIKNG